MASLVLRVDPELIDFIRVRYLLSAGVPRLCKPDEAIMSGLQHGSAGLGGLPVDRIELAGGTAIAP